MSTSLVGVVDGILCSCVDCRFSDDIKMAAQALEFFAAGNDTTSLTISFALYELALNPTIQDRLRQELKETFVKHGDFTYDAIYEMKYLDMVVNGR
jgi:cytochrome P450 family 6